MSETETKSRSRGATLFGARQSLDEAHERTVDSLNRFGPKHERWAVAWSGGKDSTATLTFLVHAIATGQVAPPKRLHVLYADTRQELPPLYAGALRIIEQLKPHGIDVEICTSAMDKRFLVYMLGRGVPPPNNNTLRWCTRQIKLDPMADRLAELAGADENQTILTITGVRQGESAIRDARIATSCGLNGSECGQGWYQELLPQQKGVRGRIATLAPILHWRVCNVWDWLRIFAPMPAQGGWDTSLLTDAYGGDEAEEINARTGCIGCPLASRDMGLENLMRIERFRYLRPLMEMKGVYRALREPRNRIRKGEPEYLKDGSMASNPHRMGPLTLEARRWALGRITDIQDRCNASAGRGGEPEVDILNAAEIARIEELIEARTWPNGWDGSEPRADIMLGGQYHRDGTYQPTLLDIGIEESEDQPL